MAITKLLLATLLFAPVFSRVLQGSNVRNGVVLDDRAVAMTEPAHVQKRRSPAKLLSHLIVELEVRVDVDGNKNGARKAKEGKRGNGEWKGKGKGMKTKGKGRHEIGGLGEARDEVGVGKGFEWKGRGQNRMGKGKEGITRRF